MNLKRIAVGVLATSLLFSGSMSKAIAANIEMQAVSVKEPEVSILAETTEWKYRTYNGKLQKRLWSITYQKWLTEWTDC